MASNDRSIGLGDLAARGQAAPRQRRSDCRNPECRDGMTPGLVAAGGGTKGAPLFGAGGVGAKRLMRWAWVRCLACNAPDDARKAGALYRHLNLSEGEMARRAELANTKAAYQPPPSENLGKLAGSKPGGPFTSPVHPREEAGKLAELVEQNKQLNARLDEMLKQNTEVTSTVARMTMQVAALLEDNAKLREQLSKLPERRIVGTLTLPEKNL